MRPTRRTLPPCILLALLFVPTVTRGQNVTLRSFADGGPVGAVQPTDIAVTASAPGTVLTGWSFGVCYDATRLSVASLQYAAPELTPEFFAATEVPGGWTSSSILSTLGDGLVLPPWPEYQRLVRARYEILGPPGTTTICICDALGVPVEIETSTGTQPPATECGDFTIEATPIIELDIVDHSVEYLVADPYREFVVEITAAQPGSGFNSSGFTFGVAHDPNVVEPLDIDAIGPLAYLDASHPFSGQFFLTDILSDGWIVGCVFGLDPVIFGTFPTGILDIRYATVPSGLTGDEIEAELLFTGALGAPPQGIVFAAGGPMTTPVLNDGRITLVPLTEPPFVRGDCSDDGNVDIADGVTILTELFAGGAAPACPAACELNVDGVHDIADPIYLFNFILLGGPPPPPPFDRCGARGPGESCPSYDSCF